MIMVMGLWMVMKGMHVWDGKDEHDGIGAYGNG
jgi:hypothetical protein